MELQIKHDKINSFNVILRTAGIFSGPKLIVDGNIIEGKKNKYELVNGTMIELKHKFADPIPDVLIDNTKVEIAPRIKGVEYFWAAMPIALLFIGGALGGLLGALATYLNFHIFRNTKNIVRKYIFTFLVTISTVLLFMVLAGLLQIIVKGGH